jgi:hypothetical protein
MRPIILHSAYVSDEGSKKQNVVIVVGVSARVIDFIGPFKGKVERVSLTPKEFHKKYIGIVHGVQNGKAPLWAEEMLALPKHKYHPAALDHLEDILKMDTRGKSSEQIRQEVERIAVDLPQGHALRSVPKAYPDRASAIAAYTAVRQALFQLQSKSNLKESNMPSKKAGTTAAAETTTTTTPTETKASAGKGKGSKKASPAPTPTPTSTETKDPKGGKKVSKDAKALAADADAKKGATRAKADFSGKYVVAGEAAKVKTTEELGMHESSVRTKVLGALMGSKAKGGTDYSVLEGAGGDKTRGAIAYLIKRGFVAKAA